MLRPPSLQTYDMRGDWRRVIDYLNNVANLTTNDLASDSDNDWTDGAIVDAHTYSGWRLYDYFFKRFNRRGLDNADVAIGASSTRPGATSSSSFSSTSSRSISMRSTPPIA